MALHKNIFVDFMIPKIKLPQKFKISIKSSKVIFFWTTNSYPTLRNEFQDFCFLLCGKIALFIHRRYFGNQLIDVHEFYGFISSFTFIYDNLSQTIPPNLKSANHRQWLWMMLIDFLRCNFIKMLSLMCNTLFFWQRKSSWYFRSILFYLWLFLVILKQIQWYEIIQCIQDCVILLIIFYIAIYVSFPMMILMMMAN